MVSFGLGAVPEARRAAAPFVDVGAMSSLSSWYRCWRKRPGGEDDAVTQEGDLLAEGGGDAVVVVKLRRREKVRSNARDKKCLMDDNEATAGKLEQGGGRQRQ